VASTAENSEIIALIAILRANHHSFRLYILSTKAEFHTESKSAIHFKITLWEVREKWLQRLEIMFSTN
jgi:hypothetical protein